MSGLYRNEKIICENCEAQTSKRNIVRYITRCSPRPLFCNHCPNFSTISQLDLYYHVAKKHSASKPKVTKGYEEFPVSTHCLNTKFNIITWERKNEQKSLQVATTEEITAKAFNKKNKHVEIFFSFLKIKMREIKCLMSQRTTLLLKLLKKN